MESDTFQIPMSAKNIIKAVNVVFSQQIKEYPDELLNSNIGNFWGDIYDQQLEDAIGSRLNRQDKDGVPPQWEQYIKPFLHEDIQPRARL